MKIYFYDENFRAIGNRELKEGEAIPLTATTTPVTLTDGQEAHFVNGVWTVSEIPVTPVVEPEPDPDAELGGAISAATTLTQLKDALLGKSGIAKVKGRTK